MKYLVLLIVLFLVGCSTTPHVPDVCSQLIGEERDNCVLREREERRMERIFMMGGRHR
jgi:uncharacterized protein YcfL